MNTTSKTESPNQPLVGLSCERNASPSAHVRTDGWFGNSLMKKPDHHIAFDWPKFQASTAGMSRQHKWSYWTACCAYYWGDCKGLENEDGFLRAVCECIDAGDWARTKGTIFNGEYFALEADGKWHQKRAREEYKLAVQKCLASENRARTAANARWGKGAASNAQAMHEDMLEESPSPSVGNQYNLEVELPPGFPKTAQEARCPTMAIPDDFVETVWNAAVSRGGRDAKGLFIIRWSNHLAAAWKYKQERDEKDKKHGTRSTKPGIDRNEGTFNKPTGKFHGLQKLG